MIKFIQVLLFFSASMSYCLAQIEAPNIILLMGDDHGWEETGYNGHPYVKTPVLDEMAGQGLRLDRFYAAAPVCSPTRASVLTGRHPNRCGTFTPNWSIRPEEVSIAHRLTEAGYACGHFGKWHLGPVKKESPTSPGAMGFQEWLSHDNFFELDPVLSRNGADPEKFKGESSKVLIDESLTFIEKAINNKQPYFVVIWFGSPHEPYAGLEEDLALYEDLPDSLGELTTRLTSLQTGQSAERTRDSVLQERYAEITAMDRAIGILRKELRRLESFENTLLWYCGDNGTPASGVFESPLRDMKGSLYEGGIRVPGIIEWPATISESRTTDVPVVTSDIFPTLCSINKLALGSRPLDGIDISKIIYGDSISRPPIYFWNYDTQQEMEVVGPPYIEASLQEGTTPLVKKMAGKYTRSFRNFHHPRIQASNFHGTTAIIAGPYKLILENKGSDEVEYELYDISADIGERNNIAGDHPDMVSAYKKQLRSWQQSVLESLTGKDYR